MHNVTSGHVEMEQAPFAPAITRCYLANLSIEHDLSQKLNLEAVVIAAIANRVSSVKLNRIAVNCMTCMLN